jgi:glutathione S-transferase
MLKLHHLDRSPYGWKVRLVLAEKRVPHEAIIPVNKNEDPAFAKLNPFKLTPVLQLDDGRVIYESTVIAEYLEDAYPDPAMMPKEPADRARLRMIEDTTDQYFATALREFRAAQFEYAPPFLVRKAEVDRTALAAAGVKVHEHLARLEDWLGAGPWFGGTIFSLADAAVAPILTGTLELLGVLPDEKRYPNLAAWRGRVVTRPSYVSSKPKEPLRIKG